jgi:uncharacterized protein YndB with AHSA1/START domain
MTDSLEQRGAEFFLRLERRFGHPPGKLWRAITDPDHLSAWYPAKIIAMDAAPGGKMILDYGGGVVTTAEITAFAPPRLFAFTERTPEQMTRESENRMRLELSPDGDGTLLIFEQSFHDRAAAASYAAGWQSCFDALDSVLTSAPASHSGVSVERHQDYVKQFGLDRGSVEETPDGWRLRFERQLMRQPIPRVWAAMTGDSSLHIGDAVPEPFTIASFASGPITEIDAPHLLAYGWKQDGRAAGEIRWELTPGPGGARIELTQTGPADLADAKTIALAAWRDRIEAFIADLYTAW